MLNFQEFARQQINEIGNQPYPFKPVSNTRGRKEFLATTDDGRPIDIIFEFGGSNDEYGNVWSLEFLVNGSQNITGGRDAYKIFATVLAATKQFTSSNEVDCLHFVAIAKSRIDLYRAMIKKFAYEHNFDFEEDMFPPGGNRAVFKLIRREELDDI